jgi:hypothetical protein
MFCLDEVEGQILGPAGPSSWNLAAGVDPIPAKNEVEHFGIRYLESLADARVRASEPVEKALPGGPFDWPAVRPEVDRELVS